MQGQRVAPTLCCMSWCVQRIAYSVQRAVRRDKTRRLVDAGRAIKRVFLVACRCWVLTQVLMRVGGGYVRDLMFE